MVSTRARARMDMAASYLGAGVAFPASGIAAIAPGGLIAVIGDSTVVGVSTGGGTAQIANSWPAQLADALNAKGIKASAQNRFGVSSGSWATLLTMDARVTSTGAWSQTGSLAPGGNAFGASAAGSASFVLGVSTKLVIYWVNNTAGRVFTYAVDGGATVDVTTTGVYEIQKTVIPAAQGAHTLALAWKTTSCNILGVEAYDDTGGMPTRIYNWGISGANSNQLVDNTDAVAGRLAGYKYHAPDLTLIEGGIINDAAQAIPAATTKANLLTMAAAVRANKPTGKVIFVTPNPIGDNLTIRAALDANVQAMREAAAAVGNGIVDVYGALGSYESALQNGLMSDTRHPTATGYGIIKKMLESAIRVQA